MVRTIVERTVAQKESARDAIRGMRLKAMSCFTTEGEADNPSGPTGINHATIQTGYGTTLDGYTIANYVDSQTIHRYHVLWSIITYNRNVASATIYLVHIPSWGGVPIDSTPTIFSFHE